jgi:hypothetical protein
MLSGLNSSGSTSSGSACMPFVCTRGRRALVLLWIVRSTPLKYCVPSQLVNLHTTITQEEMMVCVVYQTYSDCFHFQLHRGVLIHDDQTAWMQL